MPIAALTAITTECKVEESKLTIPTATDVCDGKVNGVPSVEGGFPITSNAMITWTYTDAANNSATQTQQVTITPDNTDPIPKNTNLPLITAIDSLEEADMTFLVANDACDGEITATTDANFPITTIGTTTITWRYTDAANNTVMQTQQAEIIERSSTFITTWETITADEVVTIPTDEANHTYSYTVDWGDGSMDNTIYTGNASHEYALADTYTVIISGTFPHIRLTQVDDRGIHTPTPAARQIRTVEQWGDIEWASMRLAFAGCSNLTINATDNPDLSRVTDMRFMFSGTSLTGNLNNWDVSNVTDMRLMFYQSSFNQDINDWNVSSVTNMRLMFYQSSFNQDINDWNVSNVRDMSWMFSQSSFNQDISDWNVSSVTNMQIMFYRSSFNQDINDWNVSNVGDMSWMFAQSSFNQDISDWNVSNVTNMQLMFYRSSFNQDINDWNVNSVTNMEQMFSQSSFNQDISDWNVSSVTNMQLMFSQSSFNQDISKWNVSHVTNMSWMFYDNLSFNQNISNWNVSSVTNMRQMFSGSPFNWDIGNWNVSSVTDMSSMFYRTPFNQDISSWNVSSVTNMKRMFWNARFNDDISNWM